MLPVGFEAVQRMEQNSDGNVTLNPVYSQGNAGKK